jgi:hypothetical protein
MLSEKYMFNYYIGCFDAAGVYGSIFVEMKIGNFLV